MGDKLNKYSKGSQVNVDVIVNQQLSYLTHVVHVSRCVKTKP